MADRDGAQGSEGAVQTFSPYGVAGSLAGDSLAPSSATLEYADPLPGGQASRCLCGATPMWPGGDFCTRCFEALTGTGPAYRGPRVCQFCQAQTHPGPGRTSHTTCPRCVVERVVPLLEDAEVAR